MNQHQSSALCHCHSSRQCFSVSLLSLRLSRRSLTRTMKRLCTRAWVVIQILAPSSNTGPKMLQHLHLSLSLSLSLCVCVCVCVCVVGLTRILALSAFSVPVCHVLRVCVCVCRFMSRMSQLNYVSYGFIPLCPIHVCISLSLSLSLSLPLCKHVCLCVVCHLSVPALARRCLLMRHCCILLHLGAGDCQGCARAHCVARPPAGGGCGPEDGESESREPL